MDSKLLVTQLRFAEFVLERNLADVTHEESLQSPVPSGNPLNWVVGHIVRSRTQALPVLGEATPFEESELHMYGADGFDPAKALQLDELKRRFTQLGSVLISALEEASPEQLAAAAPFSPSRNPNETVGTLLSGFIFHEAYHIGQTGILRRALGKPGQIAPPKRRD